MPSSAGAVHDGPPTTHARRADRGGGATGAVAELRAVGLVLLVATIGFSWIRVPGTPIPVWLLGAGLAATTLVALPNVRLGALAPVLAAAGVGVAAFLMSAMVNVEPYLEPTDTLRFVRMVLLCVFVNVVIGQLLERRTAEMLFWAAPVSLVVTVAVLAGPAIDAGVSPLASLIEAVNAGDPRPITYDVFRVTFDEIDARHGGLVNVSASFRHQMMRINVVALALTLIGAGAAFPRHRRSLRVVAALVVALVVVSLSRSTLLALGITGFVMAARPLVTGRFGASAAMRLAGVLVVAVVMVPTVSSLLGNTVTDETGRSYETRSAAISDAWSEAGSVLPFGVDVSHRSEPLTSPHLLVFDWFLGGGPLGLVAGVALTLVVALNLWWAIARLMRAQGGEYLWAVAAVLCFSLVLVRCLTASGGLLSPSTWIALGIGTALRTGGLAALASGHRVVPRELDAPVPRRDMA